MAQVFDKIHDSNYFACVILSGQGKIFFAGSQLMDLMSLASLAAEKTDASRK